MILDALRQTAGSVNASHPHDTYAAILGGPIFEDSHMEKLRKALRGFVTPGQCLGFLTQTRNTLERVYFGTSEQQFTLNAENSDRPRKRRKLDLELLSCSPAKATSFSLVCRIIEIVWVSLPFHSLEDESRLEAANEIQDTNARFIAPLLSAGLKRKCSEGDKGAHGSWARDLITSSILRLQYALSACTSLNFQPACNTRMESRMARLLEVPDVLPELKVEIVNKKISAEMHIHQLYL